MSKKSTNTEIHVRHYATCEYCGREMDHGCNRHWYVINRKKYEAIKNGDDGSEGVCHDCNARPGEYHHPGCDMEVCPKCGGQLISCGCHISDKVIVETYKKLKL